MRNIDNVDSGFGGLENGSQLQTDVMVLDSSPMARRTGSVNRSMDRAATFNVNAPKAC
jgi:hypothetical protein